jgi:hypothetical protein
MIINVYTDHHVKCPLFVLDFNETLILSIDFRKILEYKISGKLFQWKSSSSLRNEVRTDRWTDMTKLIVALYNFANASINNKYFVVPTTFNDGLFYKRDEIGLLRVTN